MGEERYPVDAPGWAAIDRAAGRVHPGQTPHQFSSATGYDLDSENPLPAIGVYEGREPSHWHFVTYGLSELFDKSSPHPQISGLGFELTLALPRAAETRPPAWGLRLLQGMGRHLLCEQTALDSGHLIALGAAVRPEPPTPLTAALCVPDPRLGKLATPHGSVLLLALVGVTEDERVAMGSWSLAHKVGFVAEVAPLAITEPDRRSFCTDPRTAPAYRRAALGLKL